MGWNMPWWAMAFRLTGMGWYMAVCIIAGAGGGLFLDRWLDTKVLFALLGMVFGSGVAFYGVSRMVLPIVNSFETGRSSKIQDEKEERH